MECAMRMLKVKYNDKIKKFVLPDELLNFEVFYAKVIGLFAKQIPSNKDVTLEYLDEEKDWILIENMDDLSLATQTNPLYIRIKTGHESSDVLFNKQLDNSIQKIQLVDGIKGLNWTRNAESKCFIPTNANESVQHKIHLENVSKNSSFNRGNAVERKELSYEEDLLAFDPNEPQQHDNASMNSSMKEDSMKNQYDSPKENTIPPSPVTFHPKNQMQEPSFQQDQPQVLYNQSSAGGDMNQKMSMMPGNVRPNNQQPHMSQQQPPMNQPPMNQPPMNQPPMNQPPMNLPPMNQPHMNQASMNQPPMNQASMNQPPMNQASMNQPPYGMRPVTPMNMGQQQPPMNQSQQPQRMYPANVGQGFPKPNNPSQMGGFMPQGPPMGMPPRPQAQSSNQPPHPGMGMPPQSLSGPPPPGNYPQSHGSASTQGNRFPPPQGHFQ